MNFKFEFKTPGTMLHILLADDHSIVVQSLAKELAKEPDITVIGIAVRSQQVLEQLEKYQVDLLLLDLYLGRDIRDLSLAREIKQKYPTLKVVLLTGETDNVRLINEANKMGLTGYLSKTISVEELIYELRKAAQGHRVFSPEILSMLLSGQQLPDLTVNETKIIDLLKLGMKRDAICKELEIRAKSTYDTHVQNLKEKFNASSTNELIRKAAELGFV